MMINYLITSQGRAKSSGNTTSHDVTAKTLILQNKSQAEFLEMLNGCSPAAACAVTRTHRKAEDKIRRLRGGNILNEIPVLQNEPTNLELSALDTT
jgi:hypothetical protein